MVLVVVVGVASSGFAVSKILHRDTRASRAIGRYEPCHDHHLDHSGATGSNGDYGSQPFLRRLLRHRWRAHHAPTAPAPAVTIATTAPPAAPNSPIISVVGDSAVPERTPYHLSG